MSFRRPVQHLPAIETLELENNLSLVPRLKILLTFFRSDPSPKPIDDWLIKSSLLEYLKPSLTTISDDDLVVSKSVDLKKRKRDDPVASGTLYVRDLSFVRRKTGFSGEKSGEGAVDGLDRERVEAESLERSFGEWRKEFVGRIDGMELNIRGVKFRLSAEVPSCDDFDSLNKSWEEFYAFDSRGGYYSRGTRQRPDTIVIGGLPSRWFAEPRVSSKPSILVTHTIFSVFGKIRNLNVAEDNNLGKAMEEGKGDGLVSGLHCKIWLQFEKYEDFYNAMKVLCGRSMQKQGSRLKVDYDVTWDKDGYFRILQRKSSSNQIQDRVSHMPALTRNYKHDDRRVESQGARFNADSARSRRFRE